MAKKQSLKVKQMVMLKRPCPKCQQVWAIVRGTAKKRLSVRCFSRGHLLAGIQSRCHMTYREIVTKQRTIGGAI